MSWYQPESGSFNDPKSWLAPAPEPEHDGFGRITNPNPKGRLPGAADSVGFPGGGYEVSIVGGSVKWFAGPDGLSPIPVLNISGTMSAGNLSGTFTLKGGGELSAERSESLNYVNGFTVTGGTVLRVTHGEVTRLTLTDQSKAILTDVTIKGPIFPPAEAAKLTDSTLETAGKVVTDQLNLYAGSSWEHRGSELRGNVSMEGGSRFHSDDAVTFGGIVLKESSSFTAGALSRPFISVSGSGLFARTAVLSGGRVVFGLNDTELIMRPAEIAMDSKVEFGSMEVTQDSLRVSGGSKLRNGTAVFGTLGSAGILVDDRGSEWTVTNQTDFASSNLRVRRGGFVQLGGLVNKLSARVENEGSELQFRTAFDAGSLVATDEAIVRGESIDLRGGASQAADIRISNAFNMGLAVYSSFSVTDGGFLGCESSVMGIGDGGNASMTVSGASSTWNIRKKLSLSEEGADASLTIEQGGKVMLEGPSDEPVNIGGRTTVTISGTNSVFDTRGARSTVVGVENQPRGPARVTVSDGGAFLPKELLIGFPGGNGRGEGVVIVEGAGSQLNVEKFAAVGYSLSKGTLEIRNGATAKASLLSVGYSRNDNRLLVTGAGSVLSLEGGLLIGYAGVGTAVIADRAKLWLNPEGAERILVGGVDPGTFIVDGGSSQTTSVGVSTEADFSGRELVIGLGGRGVLTVTGGGSLTMRDLYLGYRGSSSAEALVTGQTGGGYRSNVRVAKKLSVGGSPDELAPATLDVTDQGLVYVGETVRITPKGTMRLNNGSIVVGLAENHPPGNFVLGTGGHLIFEPGANLITAGGTLVFAGGDITTRLPPTPNLPSTQSLNTRSARTSLSSPVAPIPATVATIEGSVSMAAGGTLTVEMDPANSNSVDPALRVTGDVILGGKLVIRFSGAFAPAAGQKFNLFDLQGKVTGQFSLIEVIGLGPSFQYQLVPNGSGLLTLTALNDGVALSPPELSITRNGTELTISWPTTATGYVLQSAEGLGAPIWQAVTPASNPFKVSKAKSAQFFRLFK